MNKALTIKFYVLCSKNLLALKKHERFIPKEDLFIVINSLNGSFIREAAMYCDEAGIEYAVTQSDGTPATGKNSLLDIFEASPYDYAVMVDGDDFLTPHGVITYKHIAQQEEAIDVLALECQYGLIPAAGNFTNDFTQELRDVIDPDKITPSGGRLFYRPRDFWQTVEWGKYCIKYISSRENHLRVVMISKKAASLYRFDKEFLIGEDTLMYLNYKAEFAKRNLVMRHLFDEVPTYVYDTRIGGISAGESSTLEWIHRLVDEFKRREACGLMFEKVVPRLNIEFPADYVPDLCDLPNLQLPEPRWDDIMNEEYVKQLVQILTNQRNHAQSVIAELETQIYLLTSEVNVLRDQMKKKDKSSVNSSESSTMVQTQ